MGCFDSILVPCPRCGKEFWAQSKSGECEFRTYPLETCPDDVLFNVTRHAPFECDCGCVFEVKLSM